MIKPLQTLHWKFHGVPKCHTCYESERVQRILRKVYHSTILLHRRTTAIVAPERRLIPMYAHIHNVSYFKTSVTHSLNGGCSETVSCIHHTAWGILGNICHKSTELVSFDGFICVPKMFIVIIIITLFSKPMLQRLQSESVQINTKYIHIITSIIKIMGVHWIQIMKTNV